MTGYVFADSVNNAPLLNGKQLRLLAGAMMPKSSTRPLGGRSGVSAGTPAVVTATSAQWTVGPHSGVLDVSAATDGPTPYAFDQNVTGAMTAADQNNPRIDLICVTHNDSNENDNSTTAPQPVITYVVGQAAAQPQPPATPARSFVLAQLQVPKVNGGAPTVTMVAPVTIAAGGIVPVRNISEYPATPYPGMHITDLSDGRDRVWNGTAWKFANGSAAQAITATVTNPGGATSGANTIPFGVTFPNTPMVFGQIINSARHAVAISNETPTSCLVTVFRTDGVNQPSAFAVNFKLLIVDPTFFTGSP